MRVSSESPTSDSNNDDEEEEMEIDESADENNDTEFNEPPPERRRTSQNILVPPGQRGSNHIDMFNLVQGGVTYSIVEEEDGDGDDDMEMLSHYLSDKDPITKKRIQEPVKNSICGHVYERESIIEHIRFQKSRRQLYQCPVQRCTNKQLLNMENSLNLCAVLAADHEQDHG
ncbi:SP-RING-type domain-containing protein [Meloidogyne graminicola]|uniref:E3 SUMO-protein ligase NSE2 n=1 Tax=Meloidogyne graminicola TaxID=189291 RepID=A0A8S9ZGA1_9BILA|nr:SP-RING-type domain-containing protein [Meloidogyne graminicola]